MFPDLDLDDGSITLVLMAIAYLNGEESVGKLLDELGGIGSSLWYFAHRYLLMGIE